MNEEDFYNERLLSNDDYKVFLPEERWVRRAKVDGYGFNNGNLIEILKNDYPHLYESVVSEGFYIPCNDSFFYLFEIPDPDEDKIIGFATFSIYNKNSIVMNQIYVLPEYRGHKHFVATYNYFSNLLPEAEIFVRNPSRCIIDNIVEANFCSILNDRFVFSNIFFIFDQASFDDTLKYTNKTLEENNIITKYITETNLYDLKIDALVSLSSSNKVYTGSEDLLKVERSSISLVRDEDEKRFNILEKRRNDSWIQKGNYFKKIVKLLKKEKVDKL